MEMYIPCSYSFSWHFTWNQPSIWDPQLWKASRGRSYRLGHPAHPQEGLLCGAHLWKHALVYHRNAEVGLDQSQQPPDFPWYSRWLLVLRLEDWVPSLKTASLMMERFVISDIGWVWTPHVPTKMKLFGYGGVSLRPEVPFHFFFVTGG